MPSTGPDMYHHAAGYAHLAALHGAGVAVAAAVAAVLAGAVLRKRRHAPR